MQQHTVRFRDQAVALVSATKCPNRSVTSRYISSDSLPTRRRWSGSVGQPQPIDGTDADPVVDLVGLDAGVQEVASPELIAEAAA